MIFDELHQPLVLDGATGTQLQRRGLPAGACPEAWILDHPEAILDVQRRYVEAGSQAVYAPTFSANRALLKRHGLDKRVEELNLRLVALSREAAAGRALVAGDLSSCGLLPPPLGETPFEELVSVFAQQAAALEDAGVDFYAVETQMSLTEARASVLAVRSVSKKPIVCTFPFGAGGRTLCGGDLGGIMLTLESTGINAFGINCVGDMDALCRTLSSLRPLTALPLCAKPNAGLPEMREGRAVYSLPPEALGRQARRFVENGAALLGGCCGTNEGHIAAIRAAVAGLTLSAPERPGKGYYACEFSYCPEDLPQSEIFSVTADEDYEDNARDAVSDGAKMLYVELEDEPQAQAVLDSQYAVKVPLWLRIPDPALGAQFLRAYNGLPRLD